MLYFRNRKPVRANMQVQKHAIMIILIQRVTLVTIDYHHVPYK